MFHNLFIHRKNVCTQLHQVWELKVTGEHKPMLHAVKIRKYVQSELIVFTPFALPVSPAWKARDCLFYPCVHITQPSAALSPLPFISHSRLLLFIYSLSLHATPPHALSLPGIRSPFQCLSSPVLPDSQAADTHCELQHPTTEGTAC